MPESRRISYTLIVFSLQQNNGSHWQGVLETIAGQQFQFATLAELNHLLCEISGWNDPPDEQTQEELILSNEVTMTHNFAATTQNRIDWAQKQPKCQEGDKNNDNESEHRKEGF